MNKTTFALAISASLLAATASAQVSLGGTAQGGLHAAGVPVGGALDSTMQSTDRLGQPPDDSARRVHRQARHSTRQTAAQAQAAARTKRHAHADAHGSTAASAGRLDSDAAAHARADAALNPAPLNDRATGTVRSIGSDVRQTAHSAAARSQRAAGSVGTRVRGATHGGTAVQTHTRGSTGAGASADNRSRASGLVADGSSAGTLRSASNAADNDRRNGVRSTTQTARQRDDATVNAQADAAGRVDTH